MRYWDIMTCSLLDFLKAGLHPPKWAGFGRVYCGCYCSIIVPILCEFQVSTWNPEFVRGQI